ncbi:ATP-binding protein [Microcoleus sp.]|uniref:ATP-binding protein n=1 Tax=Microcoleus sp. TaxID=44472 RepID=UPI00352694AA
MSENRISICLDNQVLRHHGAVAGTTGYGKSNINSNIVMAAIKMGYCVFLFDHKPDYQDLEKSNDEINLFADPNWEPQGFDCNLRYFSLSDDKSRKANANEKLINVYASSFDPYQLGSALFHKRGEEVPQENMTLLLNGYKDKQEEYNKYTWSLKDAIEWINKLSKPEMSNILGGGSISDSSMKPMLRKLKARSLPWMDRMEDYTEPGQLPGLGITKKSPAPEIDVPSLIKEKTVNVIRVGQTQGRDYGLFLSFLLERVYNAKASNPDLPPILYLIDEAQDIFSGSKQLREACEDMLDANMRKGRSLNIAFWYGLQRFSALPESISININSRIIMAHKQADEVKNALPGASKEILGLVTQLKRGEALVSLFGSTSIVQAKMHPSKALLTKE